MSCQILCRTIRTTYNQVFQTHLKIRQTKPERHGKWLKHICTLFYISLLIPFSSDKG